MISLYNQDETQFTTNGITLDDVLYTKPKITEELNGTYTLELEVAIKKRERKTGVVLVNENLKAGTFKAGEIRTNVEVAAKYEFIHNDMLIKADDNYFRIKQCRTITHSIYIFAKQVFFTDFGDNFLEDARPTDLNGAGALNWISSHTQFEHPFIFTSDIPTVGTAYYVRKNPVAAIMTEDNSFLNTWGGEMQLDKFNVSINQQRGMDRGVTIAYGKNLQGFEQNEDDSSVVTRIMPIGYDQNNNPVLLPEKYIDSPYINTYSHPKVKEYEFSDIKVDSDNGVTLDMVYDQLRAAVKKLYDDGIDLPYYNYDVKFKELSKTEEYKNYAVLETVYMGDTLTIKHQKLHRNLKARVIKTIKEYNAAKQEWQYTEIQFGQFKPNVITQDKADKTALKNSVTKQKSDLMKAIDNATSLITGNKGGYVVFMKDANGQPTEILIMDTPDINTAKNVWRWNQEGFGHSSTGINGPYGTAITIDGAIVASYITSGILNGSLIKAGSIMSQDGSLVINLDDGVMNITGKSKWQGINSYITIDGDDLVQVSGTDKTPYYRLFYAAPVHVPAVTSGSGYTSITYTLPPTFKGKTFKTFAIPMACIPFVPSTFAYLDSFGAFTSSPDYANGTIEVNGHLAAWDKNSGTFYDKNEDMEILLIALA